jgi:hypothetical protein
VNYILTLKKDLPNYPAGTRFKYHTDKEVHHTGSISETKYLWEESDTGSIPKSYPAILKQLADDPVWMDKSIDYDSLTDLKCPICGETRGVFFHQRYSTWNREDGTQFVHHVYFEYACNHEPRKLV